MLPWIQTGLILFYFTKRGWYRHKYSIIMMLQYLGNMLPVIICVHNAKYVPMHFMKRTQEKDVCSLVEFSFRYSTVSFGMFSIGQQDLFCYHICEILILTCIIICRYNIPTHRRQVSFSFNMFYSRYPSFSDKINLILR